MLAFCFSSLLQNIGNGNMAFVFYNRYLDLVEVSAPLLLLFFFFFFFIIQGFTIQYVLPAVIQLM